MSSCSSCPAYLALPALPFLKLHSCPASCGHFQDLAELASAVVVSILRGGFDDNIRFSSRMQQIPVQVLLEEKEKKTETMSRMKRAKSAVVFKQPYACDSRWISRSCIIFGPAHLVFANLHMGFTKAVAALAAWICVLTSWIPLLCLIFKPIKFRVTFLEDPEIPAWLAICSLPCKEIGINAISKAN